MPTLLWSQASQPHVGSLDVDLAVHPELVRQHGAQPLRERLLPKGYIKGRHAFQFIRVITLNNRQHRVRVDILTSGQASGPWEQELADPELASQIKIPGVELAFRNNRKLESLPGPSPDEPPPAGALAVAEVVAFLVMKANAVAGRTKNKDGYDIWYCLRHYPGGLEALARAFEPFGHDPLVREGLDWLGRKFAGPRWRPTKMVAAFLEETDPETKSFLQQDIIFLVGDLLERLGQRSGRPPAQS